MSGLDVILISIVLVGVAIGLKRGVIRILLSIAGIYATLVVIGHSYRPISRALSGAFSLNRTGTDNFTYFVLLVAMTVAVEVTSRSTFEETRLRSVGALDNVMGGLVGVLYGALWASLFLIPVQYDIHRIGLRSSWYEAVSDSNLVPILNNIFQTGIMDILQIFFQDGIPAIFRNPVAMRVAALFLGLPG